MCVCRHAPATACAVAGSVLVSAPTVVVASVVVHTDGCTAPAYAIADRNLCSCAGRWAWTRAAPMLIRRPTWWHLVGSRPLVTTLSGFTFPSPIAMIGDTILPRRNLNKLSTDFRLSAPSHTSRGPNGRKAFMKYSGALSCCFCFRFLPLDIPSQVLRLK